MRNWTMSLCTCSTDDESCFAHGAENTSARKIDALQAEFRLKLQDRDAQSLKLHQENMELRKINALYETGAKLVELRSEVADHKRLLKNWEDACDRDTKTIESLESENTRLREALEQVLIWRGLAVGEAFEETEELAKHVKAVLEQSPVPSIVEEKKS